MSSYIDNVIDTLRSTGSIIYSKDFARAFGINAAIMYSELLSKYKYFSDRSSLNEKGYFYNTIDNMQKDTQLSGHQQRNAIKVLEDLQLIKTHVYGMPAKRFFQPNLNSDYVDAFFEVLKDEQFLNNLSTSSENNIKLVLEKLDGNNNKNNNKKQYQSTGGNSRTGIPSRTFSFEEFKNKYHIDNPDVIEAIDYFLNRFEEAMGKEHIKYSLDTWEDITLSLFRVNGEYDKEHEIFLEDLIKMTDLYIIKVKNGKYIAKEPSLCHFNNSGIKKVNYYEADKFWEIAL